MITDDDLSGLERHARGALHGGAPGRGPSPVGTALGLTLLDLVADLKVEAEPSDQIDAVREFRATWLDACRLAERLADRLEALAPVPCARCGAELPLECVCEDE